VLRARLALLRYRLWLLARQLVETRRGRRSWLGRLGVLALLRRLLAARYGAEWARPPRPEALSSALTSVIIPNLDGLPHLVAAIESLRRHTDGPVEVIVVDNGSTDGSLEWLRRQGDVRLVECGRNVGAPAARNRGLEVAGGETLLFCDNDVVFTPGWRPILLRHLAAWPDVGLVGPMSNRASGGQGLAEAPAAGESDDDFARRFHRRHAGEHVYTLRLILFFLLCHRRVVERIGGIDPRYGLWGFEDDDFCLRARLAGFCPRIARDCFIRHLGSRTDGVADLDYRRLLRQGWEIHKERWGIDPALPYGAPYDVAPLLHRPFDPRDHHVPFRRSAAGPGGPGLTAST
jgi:GT2 family glycosyltransferase